MGPKTLRKDSDIFLVGHYESQILGTKLPSNKQVLSVLFYNMRQVNLSKAKSLDLTIRETLVFWEKARIPTRKDFKCVEKLDSLYNEWRGLQKSKLKKSEASKRKEATFVNKLDDLFDIAHGNALEMMTIAEDKTFLINQRLPGRVGCFGGVDMQTKRREVQSSMKMETVQHRKRKAQEELSLIFEKVQLTSSSTQSTGTAERSPSVLSNISDLPIDPNQPSCSKDVEERGTIDVISDKLVASLDKCQISDRDAVHLILATAEALGHDPIKLIINRTSIQRRRQEIRAKKATEIKERFKGVDLKSIVVHWDGKLLPDITGKNMEERLPIIITSGETEQILNIPKLLDSTGKSQAQAIYEALSEWDLLDKVQALCCDTTASNLGKFKGAASVLEHMIGREMLYLPCRHHIFEIVLRGVFDSKMPKSNSPNVVLFQNFQKEWSKIDTNKFSCANKDVLKQIDIDHTVKFCEQHLLEKQPRDDYKELLQLTILFLGRDFQEPVRFRLPGPIHHARWMAKAIYCLKIYLFREQFDISTELNAIEKICLFIVSVYVEGWYNAPKAIKAPMGDLNFVKKIISFKVIDKDISIAASKKFVNHLWYLAQENVGLAFFDEDVEESTKKKMVKALSIDYEEDVKKKYECKATELPTLAKKGLDYFVSNATNTFFERLGINTSFLKDPPSSWSCNADYVEGMNQLKNIKVVNDTAERGVKLMDEYNNILTKNEDQKQFIIQIVKDYRTRYPNSKKRTLSKPYQ